MNRRNLLCLFALLPAAAYPAAALAFGEGDVTDALSAMMSAGSRASQVRQLRDVPAVGIVNLRHLSYRSYRATLDDITEFRLSAAKNSAGIARLRRALAANATTREALASRGVDIGRVVGVKISSSGSLRLFVL